MVYIVLIVIGLTLFITFFVYKKKGLKSNTQKQEYNPFLEVQSAIFGQTEEEVEPEEKLDELVEEDAIQWSIPIKPRSYVAYKAAKVNFVAESNDILKEEIKMQPSEKVIIEQKKLDYIICSRCKNRVKLDAVQCPICGKANLN